MEDAANRSSAAVAAAEAVAAAAEEMMNADAQPPNEYVVSLHFDMPVDVDNVFGSLIIL
jgi:hypothetical protein